MLQPPIVPDDPVKAVEQHADDFAFRMHGHLFLNDLIQSHFPLTDNTNLSMLIRALARREDIVLIAESTRRLVDDLYVESQCGSGPHHGIRSWFRHNCGYGPELKQVTEGFPIVFAEARKLVEAEGCPPTAPSDNNAIFSLTQLPGARAHHPVPAEMLRMYAPEIFARRFAQYSSDFEGEAADLMYKRGFRSVADCQEGALVLRLLHGAALNLAHRLRSEKSTPDREQAWFAAEQRYADSAAPGGFIFEAMFSRGCNPGLAALSLTVDSDARAVFSSEHLCDALDLRLRASGAALILSDEVLRAAERDTERLLRKREALLEPEGQGSSARTKEMLSAMGRFVETFWAVKQELDLKAKDPNLSRTELVETKQALLAFTHGDVCEVLRHAQLDFHRHLGQKAHSCEEARAFFTLASSIRGLHSTRDIPLPS